MSICHSETEKIQVLIQKKMFQTVGSIIVQIIVNYWDAETSDDDSWEDLYES